MTQRAPLGPIVLEHRTLTSFDGTPLGVQTFGRRDAPLMLLANGLGATVMAYRFLIDRFRDDFYFVSWDYRGLYGSARPVGGYDALTVEHHAKDGLAVLDAIATERGTNREHHALGWSMGVQVLLEIQREAPGLTRSLVLHNGVPGRPWASVGGNEKYNLSPVFDPLLAFTQRIDGLLTAAVHRAVDWQGLVPLGIRLGLVHHDLDREVFVDVARGFKKLDMHLYVELLRRLGRHDAFDVLPTVGCPTLILQGTEDKMTPMSVARRMARDIPRAALVLMPGGTHYAAVEMPELMNEHLEEFWRGQSLVATAHREQA